MYQLAMRLSALENLLRQRPVTCDEIASHVSGYNGSERARKVKLWRDIKHLEAQGVLINSRKEFQGPAYYSIE